MWNTEFNETRDFRGMSVQDKADLHQMEESIDVGLDGHYSIGLPWKDQSCQLPNNKTMALQCLGGLKKRLDKNASLKAKCHEVMEGYIQKGQASKVQDDLTATEKTWYLPHHPVENSNKPDKIRVVFDCADYLLQGPDLVNDLLQGPDLVNDLVGVLMRFRQDKIALAADIEQM